MEMLFTALRLIEGSVLLLNVIISEHEVIWCRSTSRCRFLHFSKWNLVTFPRPASVCVGPNLQCREQLWIFPTQNGLPEDDSAQSLNQFVRAQTGQGRAAHDERFFDRKWKSFFFLMNWHLSADSNSSEQLLNILLMAIFF